MKNVILLVWAMWSWKDTAWDYLSKKLNVNKYWISTWLRLLAKQRWLNEDRDTLIALWREVWEKYWDDFLAKNIIESISDKVLIIVWTRQIWQLEYLFNNTNCFSIWLLSDKEVRYNRIKTRFNDWEYSYQDFLNQEYKDNFWWLQKVDLCTQMCEHKINNDWNINDLENQLDILIKKIKFLWN